MPFEMLSVLSHVVDRIVGNKGAKSTSRSIKARPPIPANPNLPSLANIPGDVILQIIELLADASPESVPDLSLTCSYLYGVARYVRYQSLSLAVGTAKSFEDATADGCAMDNTLGRLNYVLEHDLVTAIRILRVRLQVDEQELRSSRDPGWEMLCETLPRMTGLRELHWTGKPISDVILSEIGLRPQLQLHLELEYNFPDTLVWPKVSGRDIPTLVSELVVQLQNNANLVSLRISIEYMVGDVCRAQASEPLKYLLITCPNLRHLDLDIHLPRVRVGFPTLYLPGPPYAGFGMTNGERFPPLETLKIEEYPWGFLSGNGGGGDDDDDDDASVYFWFQGYPAAVPEPKYWATQCDWSRLRHLDFNTAWDIGSKDAMFPALLAPHLFSLRSVKIRSHDEVAFDFFFKLPRSARLESVAVCSLTPRLQELLSARHGSSIAEVVLRRQRPTDSELRDIARHFPRLRSLRFFSTRVTHQAPREDEDEAALHEFPSETFAILASKFPCLRELAITFPELGDMESPHEPFLTWENAGRIFGQLFLPGNNLSRVSISTGEFGERVFRNIPPLTCLYFRWDQRNSIGFVGERKVEGGGRDGSQSGRVGSPFRVRCRQLTWYWNERLERVLEGKDKDELEARRKWKAQNDKQNAMHGYQWAIREHTDGPGVPGAFWVALDGPSACSVNGPAAPKFPAWQARSLPI